MERFLNISSNKKFWQVKYISHKHYFLINKVQLKSSLNKKCEFSKINQNLVILFYFNNNPRKPIKAKISAKINLKITFYI